MEPACGDQILAQILMTEAQHVDQPRNQTLASTRHVAGARIRTPNVRRRTETQTFLVLVIGEPVAREIDCGRTHTTDRLRARGNQYIARSYERLRECYSRIVVGSPRHDETPKSPDILGGLHHQIAAVTAKIAARGIVLRRLAVPPLPAIVDRAMADRYRGHTRF